MIEGGRGEGGGGEGGLDGVHRSPGCTNTCSIQFYSTVECEWILTVRNPDVRYIRLKDVREICLKGTTVKCPFCPALSYVLLDVRNIRYMEQFDQVITCSLQLESTIS